MATRKPTPKPAPKQKPAPKPTPKPKPAPIPEERPLPPTPTPKPAPLDLVRNPNFDAAMAQQRYNQMLAEMTARAKAGQFDTRRDEVGQLPPQGGAAFPSEFSRPSQESIINPKVLKKARDEYVEQNPGEVNRRVTADIINSRYLGQIGRGMDGFDKWFETNYINNPNSALQEQERMSLRNDLNQGRLNGAAEGRLGVDLGTSDQFRAPIRSDEDKRKIYDELMARQRQLYPPGGGMGGAQDYGIDYIEGGQRYAPVNQGPQVGGGMGEYMPVDPNTNMPSLMPIPQGQQGAMASQYQNPQGQQQQMQDYQNFLKQGMQRSDTLNQGAMAGFANMQPGMQVPQAGVQVPQAGIGQTQGPNMTGMATQQRRQNPAQRKFSTFSNKPAKFF